jgi:hypothetical protein
VRKQISSYTEIRDDTLKQCGKAAETNVTMQTDCFIT